MARSNTDLLAMKSELTNDPTGVGLTTLPADDATNAALINQVRTEIQIDRDTIPLQEVVSQIDLDEYRALADADRGWLQLIGSGGVVAPQSTSEVREGLLQLFGAGTETRTNLQSILTRDGARWEQLLADGTLEAEGDWTPSEIAQARQAV